MTSTADTTQHPDVSEISDLTEGLLPPTRMADLRRHLDGCPLCADVRASLDEIRELLGTLPGAQRMPADIAERIDAALAAEALLDSTAPADGVHVSRETSPAPLHVEVVSSAPSPLRAPDRPAGRPGAATGPGRARRFSSRRRRVLTAAVISAAAVGMGALLFQALGTSGGESGKEGTAVSAAAGNEHEFSGTALQNRVRSLLASRPAEAEPRIDKGPSVERQEGSVSPKLTPEAVPPCIQKGTGRAEAPLAFEQGEYEGTAAYLVVMPHPRDAQQVQAFVVDASCVTAAPAGTGKVLLTTVYARG
ncbi:hypothetical protein [Streptomyces sp. PR69]|uniref:hypothetical protein n=1 Tax=Streptomyces sp. PR69 TaxID=2984950 RepID=UPI0022655B44|nr:hypothetical protein [Streptomyces sp. PR69]